MSSTEDSSKRKAAGSLRGRLPGFLATPTARIPGAILCAARRVARPADLREPDALYAPLPEPRDKAVPDVQPESGESRRGVVEHDIS